jgi:hypothetical protein
VTTDGAPKTTGTPGEYNTLAGGPGGAGRPAAVTSESSSDSSSAACSGQRGCSLGRCRVPPQARVCRPHRAVRKCSTGLGEAIGAPARIAKALRARPGHSRRSV